MYRRLNTSIAAAPAVESAARMPVPKSICIVDTTLSFAMTPHSKDVHILQSPSPKGANTGAIIPAISASMLSFESVTRLRCRLKLCKNQTITVATNMAGRGTDIMLGGNSEYLAKQEMKRRKYAPEMIEQATAFNETDDQDIINARKTFRELVEKYDKEIEEEKQKVIEAGGLKIIGTERHESRRIDNQLRGRSGRQGDPGCSRFYIGLDDK